MKTRDQLPTVPQPVASDLMAVYKSALPAASSVLTDSGYLVLPGRSLVLIRFHQTSGALHIAFPMYVLAEYTDQKANRFHKENRPF